MPFTPRMVQDLRRHAFLVRDGIGWREDALARGIKDPDARAMVETDLQFLYDLRNEALNPPLLQSVEATA